MNNKHSAKRKSTRHFLLLQGPKSPFFAKLANELASQSYKTTKINFDASDRFFYGGEAIEYPHTLSSWASYIRDLTKIRGITDLIVFDDKNPIHADAIEALKEDGISIHVFADSYFDNDHITLENTGTNANSPLPREPMFYMRTPTIHSDSKPATLRQSAFMQALYSVIDSIICKTNLGKNIFRTSNSLKQAGLQLALRGKKYFVVSLADDEADKVDEIVASFSEHTKDEVLVVNSPVKPRACARVLHIANANLPKLLKKADGMIVGGSNDGILALESGTPLLALNPAIFNFAGLTNQSKLLGFWYRRVPANPSLYGKFKNYVAAKTQVNGGFYGRTATALAVKNSAKHIIDGVNIAVGNNVSENV